MKSLVNKWSWKLLYLWRQMMLKELEWEKDILINYEFFLSKSRLIRAVHYCGQVEWILPETISHNEPLYSLSHNPEKGNLFFGGQNWFKSVVEFLFLCKIEKYSEVFVKMIWTKLVISEKSCSFNAQSDFFLIQQCWKLY